MKVDGVYPSLVQGVSEQPPENRRPGQMQELVNFVPDPIRGLSRRWGSEFQAELNLGLSAAVDYSTDLESYRTFEYSNQNKDYVLYYRTATAASGLPAVLVYNKTDKAWLPTVQGTDADWNTLALNGISAITSVGRYVFFATRALSAQVTTTDAWESATNLDKAVAWVRGGAYARTYKVTVTKLDNTKVTFQYTTPTSSYGGELDTSGVLLYVPDPAGGTESTTEGLSFDELESNPLLSTTTLVYKDFSPSALVIKTMTGAALTNVYPATPTTDMQYAYNAGEVTILTSNTRQLAATYTHGKAIANPVYNKQVQDITNAYNTAVTKWISDSTKAVAPQAIAQSLVDAAVAAGLAATRSTTSCCLTGVKAIATDDGGDDTLLRGVAQEVTSVDKLSNTHYVGKVVRIRAENSGDSYYMRAVAENDGDTGFAPVTWVEGGKISRTISGGLLYGTVDAGRFIVGSSMAMLDSLKSGGGSFNGPTWSASAIGDNETNPTPYFIGRQITYLGVFQDRLVIGAGGVLRFSKSGDYLNVFRSTVLSAVADDTMELLSQGSEDDELRYSVLYNQNLVLFGKNRQYVITGQQVLVPSGANMPVMSNHVGAAEVPPLAVGGQIFYAKQGRRAASVFQIEPGRVADSPESYPVSSQLDTYLQGKVIEIAAMPKPTVLLARVSGKPHELKLFTYLDLDANSGRAQDAWHTWRFNAAMGVVLGMSKDDNGLLVPFIRKANGTVYATMDLVPVESGLGTNPYLDSQRSYSVPTGSLVGADTRVAFNRDSHRQFIGGDVSTAADLISEFPTEASHLMIGYEQESYVDLTNPFVMDNRDKPILTGRLVMTTFLVSFDESSGFDAYITYADTVTAAPFNGLIFGDVNAEIGIVPVTSGRQSIAIGRATDEFSLRIQGRDWSPLTISLISWVGQFFNRKRRV